MASDWSLPAALSPALTTREAIADALHRCMIGMDTNDTALFDSAHTQDAQWNIGGRVVQGLQAIHRECYEKTIMTLDTTHYVTNIRIHVLDGASEGSLSALYQAKHFRGQTGTVPGAPSYTMGGVYFLNLVKDETDGLWKIKEFRMKKLWVEGDPSVMGH
ncbi:hypothetical protein EYZ11_005448 [Aspergillus tanneri]|uniref:SnoaL-like domain-containing protein n=1 Tax=Aspergillus tanneri TaxID=1220188 RepID=A0A4S3JI48_9EURO|nr:uncharacterized protein ATNIH1004_008277 [Aspergillus tanneri]KAA8644079.1 hypothetical protein ATNIH1004_008277 [Aspergillus tanneri]THC95053.1 hypothetical protein EYZ11_005448 [Aspergillus tanneri]